MTARYIDALGVVAFTRANGQICYGTIPFSASDLRAEFEAFIANGGVIDAYESPPINLFAYAENKRWEREVGGMDVGGLSVRTDDRSKLLINGAYNAAKEDPSFETVWAGVYPLNATQIIAVGKALANHVNTCWLIFTTVKAGIESDPPTITTTAEIDAAFAVAL